MLESISLNSCELCPRRCGVDRTDDQRGFCGAGLDAEVFRYGAHHGEEPVLSGHRGSGTVFFSRCTLHCIYCQNHPWSQEGAGRTYDAEGLAEIFRKLADCHNWNLVSPTPWLPQVRVALELAKGGGVQLPVVYNTSGFERPELIAALAGMVDIYLPDLRYATAASAEAGSGRADYVDTARAAVRAMWDQVGPLQVDAGGIAKRGLICRLLILPGRAEEAVANLYWLAETLGRDVAVSVMSQYVPAHEAPAHPGWERRIDRREHERVYAAMMDCGFTQGWCQDWEGGTDPELIGYRMPPDG
jgi:putative pyruvate formate lyase activating enzyme